MARLKRRPRYFDKTKIFSTRLTSSTLRLLKEAAAQSGRTVSAECEFQLQRALCDLGPGATHAIMQTIARSIDGLIRHRRTGSEATDFVKVSNASWLNDPYLYSQATQVVAAAFEMFRPEGAPPGTAEEVFDAGGRRQGRLAVEVTMREIQLADIETPLAKLKPYQRWLATMKRDLGVLVSRPLIWGMAAAQAEKERALSGELLKKFIPLSRKSFDPKTGEADPKRLTQAEKNELTKIWAEIEKIQKAIRS
jgi:hypothetical protein